MNDSPEEQEPIDEELFEHFRFEADPAQSALRIDKFLMDRVANTSRNKIQQAAKDGYILVNGAVVKSNYKVRPNDIITVEFPNPVQEYELIPEDIPLDILYEDDHLIVVNKAAGMVVHPGHGNRTGTLVNALIHHFKELPENTQFGIPRPGLIHRLDKNTSGVMVIGKTEHAMTHLSNQFFERSTERRYNALVWGRVDEGGRVEGHIGRSYKDRKIMSVFPEGEQGKHAVTHYSPLEPLTYVSLIECKLETGRTHQIRAHMKYVGHPLFGDVEYGGNKILKGTTFSRYRQFVENCFKIQPHQALHAKSLGFEHPETGERMTFETEWPSAFTEVIEKWRNYLNSYS
ncbi:MAG: RluA family pseudouridine synthase [Flavobacteriales bacterium]